MLFLAPPVLRWGFRIKKEKRKKITIIPDLQDLYLLPVTANF
jgi:hypothetical protein